MTKQSEHLSSAQIENYGNRTSGAGPETAQRDEPQRAGHPGIDDQRAIDRQINDRPISDQRISDRQIDRRQTDDRLIGDRPINDRQIADQRIGDLKMNDQRVEAHLADCASCRNRLLDFHRSLFASSANPPGPDRTEPDQPKADQMKNDPPEHDTSLSGHLPSGLLPSGHGPAAQELSGQEPSGHSPSGQKPADTSLAGASPTDSALADSKFANSKFANPKPPAGPQVRTAPTPECPSDDALRQLAAGLSVDDTAAGDAHATRLLQHAATCNHCGPLLRTYTEIFSDDFTPEEQATLANLQSSSAVWQKDTARQMLEGAGIAAKTSADAADASAADKQSSQQKSFKGSTTITPARKPFSWKWALIPATAAVAIVTVIICGVVGFGVWYARRDTPEKVEILLAQAYTENRNMEMRIPYAKHSEFHELRSGDNGSLLGLPEAYRKASDQITAQMKKNPDDAAWLLASAQFDLMHWDYLSALKTLDKIEDAKFKSSSQLSMVRALALYEQAEDQHQQEPYFESADLLGKVLLNAPNDPVALFNQAIVCERIESWQCAESDWNRLLTVETDRAWADEARERLKQIESKKKAAH